MSGKIQNMVALAGNLVSRAKAFARMGYQYGGDRDIYEALGYKLDLDVDDFLTQYSRQDIAQAIINKPVGATWRGDLAIVESDDDKETTLEKEWKSLNDALSLKTVFARLDRLTALGHYGVLFLGFNDAVNTVDFLRPVIQGGRQLLYVKPLMEQSAGIESWETDTNNERYGLPTVYQLTILQPGGGDSQIIRVHHSRILHVAGEELLENEIQGAPKLEVVFNRLKDLEKLVGGSAEMFWRGARPGYQGKVDPDYQMTADTKEDLQDQIDEFEHNLRRIFINEGVDLQSLATQVSDPQNHVDVQIQMISAVTGIPKRILTGSERGELASSQDKDNWLDMIQTRREEYAEPRIVRPFVDRCVMAGALPAPKDSYSVEWSGLWEQSDKEKADVGKIRSEALKNYGSSPTNQDIIPPAAFLKMMLNLDDDQIELIEQQQEQAMLDEEREFEEGNLRAEEELEEAVRVAKEIEERERRNRT